MTGVRALALAAVATLAQAATAHAATMVTSKYSVDDFIEQEVVGDTLVWRSGGFGPGDRALHAQNTPALSSVGTAFDFTMLSFSAASGYVITGYDITYKLKFDSSGTYLVQGGEVGADFDGALPGELFVGSGIFETSTGLFVKITGPGPLAHDVSTYLSGSFFDNPFINLTARGAQDFCPPGADPALCGIGIGNMSITSTLTLDSIWITPTLITAAPEPSTYVLMGLGLVGLALRRRVRA